MTPHVLHVSDSFPPEHGGVERVVEQLAAGQAARGWKVTVLTKSVPEAPPVEMRADGIYVLRYAHAARPTPWAYCTTWLSSRAIARGLARSDRPDVVHYHLTLSAQGPLGVFGRRVLAVCSFYGPWHAEFAVEAEELAAQSGAAYRAYLQGQIRAQRAMQTRLLNRADRIIVLSEFSRRRVAELAPLRAAEAVLIPGGIDPDRFRPGKADNDLRERLALPRKAFVVLTVRRLARRMGLDLLLDALAATRAGGLEAYCLIAGSGPSRAELEARARTLGLADYVHFLGYVPDEQLPALYRLADVFVVPTRAEENFGLIVLEAAACGTPVAATPAGSLPELLNAIDPRFLARDISAGALADVLQRAFADRKKAKRHFVDVVSPRVREEYAWPRMVDRVLALYRELGVG